MTSLSCSPGCGRPGSRREGGDSGVGDEDWLITCTLITTTPNHEMKEIHDRMPVLIPPSDWDRWLDPANPVDSRTGHPHVRSRRLAPSDTDNDEGQQRPQQGPRVARAGAGRMSGQR